MLLKRSKITSPYLNRIGTKSSKTVKTLKKNFTAYNTVSSTAWKWQLYYYRNGNYFPNGRNFPIRQLQMATILRFSSIFRAPFRKYMPN